MLFFKVLNYLNQQNEFSMDIRNHGKYYDKLEFIQNIWYDHAG